MSRILKRPMFRTGGSTNEGIMHGLVDRKGYRLGDRVEEITAAMDKYAPIPKSRFPLGQIGLNLASGEFADAGTVQNIVRSLKGPYEGWTAADDARAQALAQRKASAVGVAVSEDAQMRMQMLKNMGKKADVGRIAQNAKDIVAANMINPETNKPYTYDEAFAKAYRDAETSPGKSLLQAWRDFRGRIDTSVSGVSTTVADNQADWQIYIRPNLPPDKIGGEVPTYYDKTKDEDFINVEAMTPGKYYWDEQDGELKEVIEENGEKVGRIVPGWRDKYYIK